MLIYFDVKIIGKLRRVNGLSWVCVCVMVCWVFGFWCNVDGGDGVVVGSCVCDCVWLF